MPRQRTTPFVERAVDAYLEILSIDPATRPEIVVVNRPAVVWLGMCHWSSAHPRTSTIYLQQRILKDEKTAERVIAHEVCHHVISMNYSLNDIAALRLGIRPPEHGRDFLKAAAVVNQHAGTDFVTPTSDQSYVEEANTQEYFVIVKPVSDRHGDYHVYSWAFRMGPTARKILPTLLERGIRVTRTTDLYWTRHGVRLNRHGQWSRPRELERAIELAALYDSPPGNITWSHTT